MIENNALSEGVRIGGYEIRRVLGAGSFGITYLAHDAGLSRNVALKEYFPVDYAVRSPNGHISPRNQGARTTFDWGLDRFSEEARTLARFRHPNIVHVLQLLTDINGTAYIVMELLDGHTLEEQVRQEGVPARAQFLSIFNQLLDGLEAVHSIGILHRDVKPSNVVMRDGTPVLIDFGSARDLALQKGAGFSAVVTDGYSPPEQYSRTGVQAAYTDIYAMAGTAEFMLTGIAPPPSAARMDGDPVEPVSPARAAEFWPAFLTAINRGFALRSADRPGSIADWRVMCRIPPEVEEREPHRPGIDRRLLLIGGAGAAVAAVAGIAAWRLIGGETLSSSARPLSIAWDRPVGALVQGGEQLQDPFPQIIARPNGAILAAFRILPDGTDHMLAQRIDDNGQTTAEWVAAEANGRAHAILPGSDGGAYVGGAIGNEAVIARLGPNWQLLWQKSFGSGTVTSINPGPDGAVVVGLEGLDLSGARLLMIGPDGTKQRENVVEISPKSDSTQRVIALSGGGYAVLGLRISESAAEATGTSGTSLWVAILDERLEEVTRPREAGLGASRGWDIAELDGDIFVTGSTDSGRPGAEPTLLMLCLDKKGGRKWKRSDYPGMPSSGRSLAVGPGNRLYVAGSSGMPRQMHLWQIGPEGDPVWDQPTPAPAGGNAAIASLSLRENGEGFAAGISQSPQGVPQLTVLKLS